MIISRLSPTTFSLAPNARNENAVKIFEKFQDNFLENFKITSKKVKKWWGMKNLYQSYKCKLHNKSKEHNGASFYAKLCDCFSLNAEAIKPPILNRRSLVPNIEIADFILLK